MKKIFIYLLLFPILYSCQSIEISEDIVFDFHMHDIIDVQNYNNGNSFFEKFGYSIINLKNKKKYFEDTINWLFNLGYKPKYLSELYNKSYLKNDLIIL